MSLANSNSVNQTSDKSLNILIYFGIFWYILIATINYFNARPLWGDEESVFLSVKSYSFQQMFGAPLDAIQVFPRLYLFFIQQFSKAFDYHVLSLRFLPFVCMMTAFALWLRLAKNELKDKIEYLTFVLSWTASSMLLYYASELKQYSMDVLAGVLYTTFIYKWQARQSMSAQTPSKMCPIFMSCLIALPFLGWFSYPSYLFALILGYNLILATFRKEIPVQYLYFFAGSLLIALVCSYFFDMRYRHADEVTTGFGDYFISFASVGEFFRTFGEGFNNLFSRWLVEHPRGIKMIGRFFMVFGSLYLFYGFFADFKKDRYMIKALSTIAFALFLGLVLLGALHKYPFTVPRTALFYCPFVLFLVIKGIRGLRSINSYAYVIVHGLYFIFLILLTIGLSRLVFLNQSLFLKII